jgi:hypothetical protein
MAQPRFCQDCTQKHDCKKVYEQLGAMKGPSVVVKVVLAFLLPLVIFIASLAAFGEIFAGATDSQPAQTALSLLPALLVTSGCVLIMGAINRRLNKGG